jgi:uncharacterized protein (DUF736 family)
MSEQKKDIGALWARTSSKGNQFLSGFVQVNGEKYEIIVFQNNKDGNDKRPDYRIFPSGPRIGFSESIPF